MSSKPAQRPDRSREMDDFLARIGMPKEIVMRHRLPQFNHLFTSDAYSAGYYSYLWSEVMDADAFGAFEEAGDIFDPDRAKYDLKYYVAMAKELQAAGAHVLGLKDMAGLLKPAAARVLIKALKEEVGLPVHFHTHDTGGIAGATVLAASAAGVDAVDCAMDAFSGNTSQPCLGSVVEALRHTDRDTGLDIAAIRPFWTAVLGFRDAAESQPFGAGARRSEGLEEPRLHAFGQRARVAHARPQPRVVRAVELDLDQHRQALRPEGVHRPARGRRARAVQRTARPRARPLRPARGGDGPPHPQRQVPVHQQHLRARDRDAGRRRVEIRHPGRERGAAGTVWLGRRRRPA